MDDLLAARSQVAMSLAFHIIFAAIGIAMPLLMIIAEWKWLRSKDEIYLTLAQRWAKGTRVCAAAQVTLILLGWAFAQFPHLVEPDLTINSAAAPQITLQLLLGALAAGAILLFPSYYYLF